MTPNPSAPGTSAGEALSRSLVLRGAWLRIDAWYRSGNLAPQPELARWRLHPERELRRLGEQLQNGEWKPCPWKQVPYPKKGSQLRHYTLPTIRDQVAFMAHMVLLAPFLDHQFESFAFGNRWYRPIAWHRRESPARWIHRPYPLLTRQSYLPYARSHGLYRRVAHWTVASMTGAPVLSHDYGGPVQSPDDYHEESLPPWVSQDWWQGATAGRRAYWAALDLELAYPSVRLDGVEKSLGEMLADVGPLQLLLANPALSGFPAPVRGILSRREELRALGTRLVTALRQVEVVSGDIPPDAWRPFHARSLGPQENKGLPTGLAISGMLLNVVLHSTDERLLRYLSVCEGDQRGAIVRFADDMYILSKSCQGLLNLLDEVWRGVAASDGVTLATPKSPSNLYLNLAKLNPPALKNLVVAYLERQGWRKCKHCQQLRPPKDPRTSTPLGAWWAEEAHNVKLDRHREELDRSSVGPNEVGPFVTTLVARLSELGTDTLTERFGEGARNRVERLHELARFEIVDEQVRDDTRRSFAANRLVRAWLPLEKERARDGPPPEDDDSPARAALAEIRYSVAYVLGRTPWKFSLWRSAVRAAARRPVGQGVKSADDDARSWLSDQLQRIAHVPGTTASTSWMHIWPEVKTSREHNKSPSWIHLYLSFHRTAFWNALGDVTRELWRHHDRTRHPRLGDPGPPPHWWTVRAVPQGDHASVARFLGELDNWINVLYPPNGQAIDLHAWPWELDQLTAACLASSRRKELAEALELTGPPAGNLLMIPGTALRDRAPRTTEMLGHLGRVLPEQESGRALDPSDLAHLHLAGRDSKLGAFLFPPDQPPRISGARRDPAHIVSMGLSLGCSDSISRDLIQGLVPEPSVNVQVTSADALTLLEYGRIRRTFLARKDTEP